MSSLNLNTVMLAGHITADPELRQTESGIPVCHFNLAVNRRKAEGEEKPVTDFISIVTWRKTADTVARYFRKGSAICLSGRIEVRSYTDRDGNKRVFTEVNAYEVYFVDSKQQSTQQAENYSSAPLPKSPNFDELDTDEDLPF